MAAHLFLPILLTLVPLTLCTPLNQNTIISFNQAYPRCFNSSAPSSQIRSVEELPSLFSTKYKVTLAPRARCSFLATGSALLEWDPVEDPKVANQVWTQVLNYTQGANKGECMLAGDNLEKAARNVTNGRWLRADKNCAYYVVVGNNMRFPTDQAVFYFSRTAATRMMLGGLSTVLAIAMYNLM